MTELTKAILRNSLALAIFAAVTAGFIAVTHVATSEQISLQQKKAQTRALREIIPDNQHDNDFLNDQFDIPSSPLLGDPDIRTAYRSRKNGTVNGVLIPFVANEGYSGNIRLIAGIAPDGKVLGVRVLAHQETPGLGDKVEARKSDWIHQFEGKSLASPEEAGWKVIKDGGTFDQLTGATITPRAIVKAVYRLLKYVDKHHALLFEQVPASDAYPPVDAPAVTNEEATHD